MNTQYKISSPVGTLYLVASDIGLQKLSWTKETLPLTKKLNSENPAHKILSTAVRQLNEYFKGHRKEFNIPLDLMGTTFQKETWQQLQQIPFGQTLSYLEVSYALGHPRASRAVGNANGHNPICIIIPCHRVITSQGKLGGYSGGISKKIKLLALENIKL